MESWDRDYGRDVPPPDYDEIRKRADRKERVVPFWDLLVEDKEPKVNKETLLLLMHDLKDEGNALFKEEQHDIAWMHYRNAIFVVRILENRFYHHVEKEFTSSLFSNRAFCCLKKDMYHEAAQDCEAAITEYAGNLKAYYRQAVAYKHQKKYNDALRSAQKGMQIQQSSALKDLVEELQPLIKSSTSTTASARRAEPSGNTKAPSVESLSSTTLPARPSRSTESSGNNTIPARRVAEVSAKSAAPVFPTVHSASSADSDWLAGTNVTVTQKHLENKTQKMASKKKSTKVKAKVTTAPAQTNGSYQDTETESDDPNSSFGEDDEKFASMLKGVRQHKLGGARQKEDVLNIVRPDIDDQEDTAWAFPHDVDNDSHHTPIASSFGNKVLSGAPRDRSMGLDNFLTETDFAIVSDHLSGTSSPALSSNSRRSSRSTQSPHKAASPVVKFPTDPAPIPDKLPTIIFPLMDDYDFKLVCRNCFIKTGEGVKGSRLLGAAHSCQKDVLVVRKKNIVGMSWIKVRPKPETTFYGGFKICAQFPLGQSCKVGEGNCTFPHHQGELKLWTLEREGKFRTVDFITKCRENNIDNSDILTGVMSKRSYIPGLNFTGKKKQDGASPKHNKPDNKKAAAPKATINKPTNKKPQNAQSVPASVFSMNSQAPPGPTMMGPPAPQTGPTNKSQGLLGSAPSKIVPFGSYKLDQNWLSAPASGYTTSPFSQPPPQLSTKSPKEEDPSSTEPTVKVANPLAQTHTYMIICQLCFKSLDFGVQQTAHNCEQNLLVMRPKNGSTSWMRVRERKNHRDFPGNYILCQSIKFKNPIFCKYGEERCSFAHNDIERNLWQLEKQGVFHITEFIMHNRKGSESKGFSLKEILVKHGGYFEFVCRSCYFAIPPKISKAAADEKLCTGIPPHTWKEFKILAHCGPGGVVTLINDRGFLHKTAFFKICNWLHFCQKRIRAECRFAHSVVERDVWMLERDLGIKRHEIVNTSKQSVTSTSVNDGGQKAASVKAPTSSDASLSAKTAEAFISAAGDGLCPFVVWEVCETCWKKGQKVSQDGDKDRCQKGHTNWAHNKVYLLSPSRNELRSLPRRIPVGLNFIVCKNIREKKKCVFTGGGPCQFAHSTEEVEAWKWMCANNVTSLQRFAEISRAAQKKRSEASKSKISGQSVISVGHGSVGPAQVVRAALPIGDFPTNYCHYCGVPCNSQKQWDEHCASVKHNFNVNSDKEHQWNFRQPPWGAGGTSYALCLKHEVGRKCQYSSVPDMYNLCRYAHSQAELDEWKERYEWRQMKREMAREKKVFSYMDQLLEKYEQSEASIKVISDSIDGVAVETIGDLNIYEVKKISNYTWTFVIRTERSLDKVALLYNRDRLHFSLLSAGKPAQIAQGDAFKTVDTNGQVIYKVELQFNGGMFGSFQQWIVFYFGTEPVLCRKITVEVGSVSSHEKVHSLRQQLTFDRWTSQTREIVRRDKEGSVALDEMLIRKYKEPASSELVVTQDAVVTELNRHNYVPKMHKLLELEEMTRHQIISSYNLCTTVEVKNAIEEEVYVFAHKGELFAKVPLQDNLTEDTDAGRLILTSVRHVLLAPQTNSDKTVYEAAIVQDHNFNYDGRGRDYIYLCLSPVCVSQLGLRSGQSVSVEIQFQMNRKFFCEMHYAVDQLQNTDIVFPDIPKINPLRNEKHNLRINSSVLNPDQMAAVRHIVAERSGYTPPFVMYGAFGTGKTETMAQAAMVLVKERPDTRILICAQSNSAADLYIVKHFDPLLRKSQGKPILRRVYFTERRVYTVAPEVMKYCLLSADNSSFEAPTADDIKKHRIVVVTVNTAISLTSLELQGHFTHVFIDEAAQLLECETIMPLTLASQQTCVVLSGDHMQISPKVYSEEARNQRFHHSLLQRLYNFYFANSQLISETSPLNIPLKINYRTKMEILRFISAIFYGGPDKLISEANIRSVVDITPLMFHAVQGREVQDENSISYYNMSEVQEIVERIEDLYQKWPEEWGPRCAKEIGVVTPYYDQVVLIRKALKKRNGDLRDVIVDRIHGVQGREFRAMFLSTVRTRHLIEAPHVQDRGLILECDGEGGDFGFLSDSKLLNTALTRAQSQVVVVGDPVALCAIGDCVMVWRTYLKHCQNMGSLYPQKNDYESIKQQVQNLLNSPARERLLQIANQRQQNGEQVMDLGGAKAEPIHTGYSKAVAGSGSRVAAATEQTFTRDQGQAIVKDAWGVHRSEQHVVNGTQSAIGTQRAMTVPPPQLPHAGQPTLTPSPVTPLSPVAALSEITKSPLAPIRPLGASAGLRPPAPLPLLQQSKQEAFMEIGEEYTLDPDDVVRQLAHEEMVGGGPSVKMASHFGKNNNSDVKPDLIRIEEIDGHAALSYNSSHPQGDIKSVTNYTVTQLKQLITRNPAKYVECVLHIESDDNIYADVKTGDGLRITLNNRKYCGQALHMDHVVMEIATLANKSGVKKGHVVGVLKSSMDLQRRYIVCRVDSGNTGILVPLNSGMPRMYNLTAASNTAGRCVGNVTIYKIATNKKVRFSHIEKVDATNLSSKLFVVRFLKWESNLQLPLCVCIGVLPAGDSLSSGLRALDLDNHIVKEFPVETAFEVEHNYKDSTLSPKIYQSRLDMRDRWSFTISAPMADEIGMALSIDETGDGSASYQIGVHIADVSHFVKKNSGIDLESRSRGLTLASASGEPAYMLPSRLCTDLCSLKPGVDRVAVSLLLTVQHTGEVTQVSVQKTVINSKKRFSYEEAEAILHDPAAASDYLKSCVLVLFQFSGIWRRERLGNANLYQDLKIEQKLAPLTHQLMEEVMMMAESHAAKVIINNYPLVAPLVCQQPPPDTLLSVWKQEHAADAVNSIAITKPFLDNLATCKCKVACTCIVNYMRQNNMKVRDHMDVCAVFWDALVNAASIGDNYYVQSIVVAAENHPQLAVAMVKLQSIQKEAYHACSSDVLPELRSHYTINLSPYVCLTSPLSCYIDIVTLRMLSACIESSPCPYTQSEMQSICAELTSVTSQCTRYKNEVNSLLLSLALRACPLVVHPVVEAVNDGSFVLCFPTIPYIPNQKLVLPVHLISPIVDAIKSETGRLLVQWKERVYSLTGQDPNGGHSGELNTDRFIYRIPAFHWQTLLRAVREEEEERRLQKLGSAVDFVHKQVVNPASDRNYLQEATCEADVSGTLHQFAEFSLELHQNQVIQVQLSSAVNNGIITPIVQLLNLTPSLDICVEHRTNPVRCFTKLSSVTDTGDPCPDVETYQKHWRPLINIEAADQVAVCGENVVIHGVTVAWHVEWVDGRIGHSAQFSISYNFLTERMIKLYSDTATTDLFTPANLTFCQTYFADFICIRYSNLTLPNDPTVADNINTIVNNGADVTWVGHCTVEDVCLDNDLIVFKLGLNQSSVPFPEQLLQKTRQTCTAELIPRPESNRNMLYALQSLGNSSNLAKKIALGQATMLDSNKLGYRDVEQIKTASRDIVHVPNQQQDEAIRAALGRQFTAIQGVVGSGKSVVAVKLTYAYTQRNRRSVSPKAQVLLCGPNETSVDILNGYLIKLNSNCPKIVRIYGNDVERSLHPMSNSAPTRLQHSPEVDSTFLPFSVYELIRSSGSPYGVPLQKFDMLFSLYPEEITAEKLAEYHHVVEMAETALLLDAEVILCTCTTSATEKLMKVANIQQIVIDDCGMCWEPDALIPITLYKGAVQVTLIGDGRLPVSSVSSIDVKSLAANTSLMSRYSKTAVNLTVHYRVHEGIIGFPGKQLYDGKVLLGSMSQRQSSALNWPAGHTKPTAFCHVDAQEEITSVGAGYSREDRIANTAEADFVVKAVATLVARYKVSEATIAVLTATRAQLLSVQAKLHLVGHQNVKVMTVPQALGAEFDHVVFSTVRSLLPSHIDVKPTLEWKARHLGVVSDPAWVYLGLTRARKGLTIVGNKHLLDVDDLWSKLLHYYDQEKKLVTVKEYFQSMSM